MTNETKTETPIVAKAATPPQKEKTAVKEAKLEKYETTGSFQLYDVSTRTLVPHDGYAELMNTNPFVIHNLKNKKLKKVN